MMREIKSFVNPVTEGMTLFRIGFGYDAHRLVEGRALILGGVEIPHSVGLDGHSDADVLTHAVIDAIIGALGMGDIGQHFPDTDPAFERANSLSLLGKTMEWMMRDGFKVNNLDTTIVAAKPKLAPYLPAMKKKLAKVLDVTPEQVNIKATTTEGMGFCGRKEGIAAYAVISMVGVFK
jgi:2-C-methyl-D-erythritol 2,4-cyclodiphosphate synthase